MWVGASISPSLAKMISIPLPGFLVISEDKIYQKSIFTGENSEELHFQPLNIPLNFMTYFTDVPVFLGFLGGPNVKEPACQ